MGTCLLRSYLLGKSSFLMSLGKANYFFHSRALEFKTFLVSLDFSEIMLVISGDHSLVRDRKINSTTTCCCRHYSSKDKSTGIIYSSSREL